MVTFKYKNGFETQYHEEIARRLEAKGEGKVVRETKSKKKDEDEGEK